LGSGNQCPVASFGVLTAALLKIRGVLGYYAGVLVNKAVIIFRVTQSEKNDLDCLILQTKTLRRFDRSVTI
jgi:hypothetical protein